MGALLISTACLALAGLLLTGLVLAVYSPSDLHDVFEEEAE
ncbi:hypothetical protein ACFYY8_31275 [Streptosporangium sp. NPDC001559]